MCYIGVNNRGEFVYLVSRDLNMAEREMNCLLYDTYGYSKEDIDAEEWEVIDV